MIWQGKELSTVGEIFDAAVACKDRHDAARFAREYARTHGLGDAEHGWQTLLQHNLGVAAMWYGEEMQKRVDQLFGAKPPLLGV